jgi:hypothetical protein
MLIHVIHDDDNTYTADVPDDAEYVYVNIAAARFLNNDGAPLVSFVRDNAVIRLTLSVKPTLIFGAATARAEK